jgi:hypothetical protein
MTEANAKPSFTYGEIDFLSIHVNKFYLSQPIRLNINWSAQPLNSSLQVIATLGIPIIGGVWGLAN